MNRLVSLLFAFCVAVPALAAPALTAINPASGPTAGGTPVTISGSGFTGQTRIYFGNSPATMVPLVNDSAILAVTPAHLPGVSNLYVADGASHLMHTNVTFRFEGPAPETLERLLLPLFTEPVSGALGSVFHSTLTGVNKGVVEMPLVYGLEPVCNLSACIFFNLIDQPYTLMAGDDLSHVYTPGKPGYFLYVPKEHLDAISLNLRVHDESRSALNYGTEMPIVRERDFREGRIVLPGVPGDERFRATLRIYAQTPMQVNVTFAGQERTVFLAPGENIFQPAYAQVGNFPTGFARETMTIEVPECGLPEGCGELDGKVWAFVSVTNNETQLISTITPQP